ncbi:phosphatidylglycerol lysyltransferase [Silicimonas algicola]|uniref:Phosphatidylglycerol lysyltransferase n=1 Tax=Silicimonas algicola TaxID=1826607 RepID=A0A316GCK0_9RHOB|nr:phosphatidylglycerol lysyltransferase [Silicimonas algicola]
MAAVCAALVVRHLGEVSLLTVAEEVRGIGAAQWLIALVATCASFAAAGQYDALFHRWLGTGVRAARAGVSGAVAIALAQTLGFGLATGAIARWRALPELSLPNALRVTNYVSFTFMAALSVLAALALSVSDIGSGGAGVSGLFVIPPMVGYLVLSVAQPAWLPVSLPPLRLVGRLTVLAITDTALASLALWALLPAGSQPDFSVFLAAFLVALGAGLLSGAPGGVGPFELALVTLLPAVPETELMAAVLAFRLVYYALPACAALVVLARPSVDRALRRTIVPALPPAVRAEAGLARQSGQLSVVDGLGLHVVEASQCLVALGSPVCGERMTRPSLRDFGDLARQRNLFPALYKADARTAGVARRSGWTVLAVSEDASVSPADFALDVPERRQLRRKLGRARKAGVTIESAGRLPLQDMSRVAGNWTKRTGGERGFSMGRYCPDYLAGQRVWLARRDGRLVAFASFHIAKAEWCLDLMRNEADMPDGTMHALIAAALEAARAEGVRRVSLAAMPLESGHPVLRRLTCRREAQGLRQFKCSFHPRRQTLYLAAPNLALLVLAGTDILLRIAKPLPLLASTGLSSTMRPMQGGHSNMDVVPAICRPHVGGNRTQMTQEKNR